MGTKFTGITLLLLCATHLHAIDKKGPVWKDPQRGKMYSKVNFVQIPLTAYEQHLLGKVKSVRYTDYKLSEIADSLKVLDDSGYNVYDKTGHLVDQNEYEATGAAKWKCKYGYLNNKATEWNADFAYRNEKSKWTFKYDAKGRMTERVGVNKDMQPAETTAWKYDAKGNCIEEIYYDKEGKTALIQIYKYDERGNQIELVRGPGDIDRTRMTASYDALGNKVGGADYSYRDGKEMRTTWKATFDELGRQTEVANFDKNGNPAEKYTYKYDQWDNTIEALTYNADGTLNEEWSRYNEYVYDANGNITKNTAYKMKNGKKVAAYYTETTYTYY